jgi:glycogen debranching enzyme
MYGVDPEEQLRFNSTSFYLPAEKRKLIFCGFGGIIAELERSKRQNVLSSGLFDSIREGNWLLDYYLGRLKRFPELAPLTAQISTYFEGLKRVHSYLRPKYFTDFIYNIYEKLQDQICKGTTSRFNRKLRLATTQFISSFDTQKPMFRVTLAAGLPHFAAGWTRCWARDTFMSN